MKLFQVVLNMYLAEDEVYFVVSNTREEALEILSIDGKNTANSYNRVIDMDSCYFIGCKIPAENITKEYASGYFNVKPFDSDSIDSFVEIVLPFIPVSIRKHYIDIALRSL